ncbi:ABC transporter ATP-binding protein [Desulfonema ishimotonii]|uniref:ABC transporter ATP-binding protein n=1 Tax=Desulfonema ishimotonii TaxID=45657 RepID=A0A401FXY9_9BACT|nr:ABC transporter ATP-binding protein [Desulfonema ishimotonii]GBC61816.1 ABC transporter ATP-binding protein [Desulfonema ishimotonii]
MSNKLLRMKDIQLEGFDGQNWKPVINHIDLKLDRGEVLGLIGESGAGKSTLGLAAMGYTRTGCRITDGSVVFDGTDLMQIPGKKKRALMGSRIAYVAQSAAASFNPAHKLIRQFAEIPVQHGIMTYAEAEKKAIDLYRQLDLPNPEKIGYRYPHQVSGGQLQRAMVAMAMAADPDLIIFDEPTTALDVTTQIEVLAAIKEIIRTQNTAAIYITHDLAVVAQLADRIMVLRHGHLVEEGDAREILENPKEEYTRDLLSVRRLKEETAPPPRDPEVILELDDVSAAYTPDKPVVKNVKLKIRKKKTVAVVGESGSGKTTMARIITGLLPPYKGSILFNGEMLPPDLASRDRETLRRLQMIYQMPDVAVNPRQKIQKILGRPLSFYFNMQGQQQKDRIAELLEMVELPAKYMHRYPSELSGGEKQRVCIARALAAEPELIICDEVTSALDQLVAEGVLKLLQDLQNELGVSYLFITHDLATVKAIADEIVVMLNGRIVEQGTKKEILKPPHHEYTELLLSSVPEMDPEWLDNLLEERRAAA